MVDFDSLTEAAKNHPKDRHVVAAAMKIVDEGEDVTIVTENLRDFAPDTMPSRVVAVSSDTFLLELLAEAPLRLVEIIWAHAQKRRRPPIAIEELLAGLGVQAPRFVKAIEPRMRVRTDEQMNELLERFKRRDSVADVLVAIQDLGFVSEEFRLQLGKSLANKVQEFAQALVDMLREPTTQQQTLQLLRDRGISLPLAALLGLKAAELHLLLEKSGHRTQ